MGLSEELTDVTVELDMVLPISSKLDASLVLDGHILLALAIGIGKAQAVFTVDSGHPLEVLVTVAERHRETLCDWA